MSDIVRGFRTYLLTKSAVTDAFNALYQGVLPQTATLTTKAYGVLTLRSAEVSRDMAGMSTNRDARIQVDIFAATPDLRNDAAEGVVNAAGGYTGAMGSETCRGAWLEDEFDDIDAPENASDDYRYRRTQIWRVHLAETAPTL